MKIVHRNGSLNCISTVEPPFIVPKCKVFPHLMLIFNDPKSFIHLKFFSVYCSDQLLLKETINEYFTI